jgi:hypothetical protein
MWHCNGFDGKATCLLPLESNLPTFVEAFGGLPNGCCQRGWFLACATMFLTRHIQKSLWEIFCPEWKKNDCSCSQLWDPRGGRIVFRPLPCALGDWITVRHCVPFVHIAHVLVVLFHCVWFYAITMFISKLPSTGGLCMLVSMWSSLLSRHTTAVLSLPECHPFSFLRVSVSKFLWHSLPVRFYFPTTVHFLLCQIVKQVRGWEKFIYVQFVATPFCPSG